MRIHEAWYLHKSLILDKNLSVAPASRCCGTMNDSKWYRQKTYTI